MNASATHDGLRRIGVAVAVWAAMAAVRDSDLFVRLAEARARSATTRAGIWRQRCAKMSRELEAERAARRKWELRLRARRSVSSLERLQGPNDRLFQRAVQLAHAIYLSGGCGPRDLPAYEYALLSKVARLWPIAGPRGVLP